MSGMIIFSSIIVLLAGGGLGWFIRHKILQRQLYTNRQRFEELKALQATQQHEISSLRQKLMKSEHTNGNNSEVESAFEQLKKTKQTIEIELKNLHSQTEQTKNERDSLFEQNSELESLTAELQQKIDLMNDQEKKHKSEITQLKARLSKLQRHAASLESKSKSDQDKASDGQSGTDKRKQKTARKVSTDKLKQRESENVSQPTPPHIKPPETFSQASSKKLIPDHESEKKPAVPVVNFSAQKVDDFHKNEQKPKRQSPPQVRRRSSQKSTTKFAARPSKKPESSPTSKSQKKAQSQKPSLSNSQENKSKTSSTGIRMLEAFADEIRGKKNNSDKSG